MNEQDITTPRDLDTALSANALRKHSQLWRVAEGRFFLWGDALAAVLALALCLTAFSQARDDPGGAVILLAVAFASIGARAWGRLQRQFNALVELVKRLESDRS